VFDFDLISRYHDPLVADTTTSLTDTEPIRHGVVVNWEALEAAWTSAVQSQLSLASLDGCSLIATGTACGRAEERTQICEIVFEVLGASSLLINAPGAIFVSVSLRSLLFPEVFALYSYGGAQNGFVVESGAGITSLAPIYEGHLLPQRTRFPVAGHHVTARLASALVATTPAFNRLAAAEEVKEKHW
jgi:actin-related protein